MLLAKWKEELLTFIFLYLITNYRSRQGVENYVSSSGWVRHLQRLRPIFFSFHAFFLRAERNPVTRQTPRAGGSRGYLNVLAIYAVRWLHPACSAALFMLGSGIRQIRIVAMSHYGLSPASDIG